MGGCGNTDPQRIPANLTLNPTALSFTSIGEQQQLSPTITDAEGNALPSDEASWTSSDATVATVTQTGLVTARGSGSADITATAGAASATAHVTVVQTPAQLQKLSGDAQTGPAGATLPAPLVVQVKDSEGNPVQNVAVIFSVVEGEGSLSNPSPTTDPDGAAATTFTTGTVSGSTQSVTATIQGTALSVSFTATATADPTAFNIDLRFLSTATETQRKAFNDARLRWQAVITQDIQDVLLSVAASACGTTSPAINQTIDDVLILVTLLPIDGQGGTLGGASPCRIRTQGSLTVLGAMQFDTADLEMLESEGSLSNVILHEMGHVLGFGTLWPLNDLLANPAPTQEPLDPNADPHFVGPQAISAFDDVGGTTYVAGAKVPVENIGGPGTANSHWRESVFGSELMTGFIGSGSNPLSVVSMASLADLGYIVDFTKADAFVLPSSLRAFGTQRTLHLQNDILRLPIKKVDSGGRETGEFRR